MLDVPAICNHLLYCSRTIQNAKRILNSNYLLFSRWIGFLWRFEAGLVAALRDAGLCRQRCRALTASQEKLALQLLRYSDSYRIKIQMTSSSLTDEKYCQTIPKTCSYSMIKKKRREYREENTEIRKMNEE